MQPFSMLFLKKFLSALGLHFLAHGLSLVVVWKGLLLLWNMSSEEVGSVIMALGLSNCGTWA